MLYKIFVKICVKYTAVYNLYIAFMGVWSSNQHCRNNMTFLERAMQYQSKDFLQIRYFWPRKTWFLPKIEKMAEIEEYFCENPKVHAKDPALWKLTLHRI